MSPMDQKAVALYNRANALMHLRRSGALSRTELASRLGLTQTALTRIAAEFLDIGIVTEEPVHDLRRDKPRALLRLNPDWGYVATVSLMHNLAVGIVDLSGRLVHSERIAGDDSEMHHAAYREAFEEMAPEAIAGVLAHWRDRKLLGVGVLSAGYVGRDGTVYESDNLPRRNMNIRAIVSEVTDLPVTVDEESRLLLLSKLWQEGREEWESVVALNPGVLGSGGGQALAIDGKVFYGCGGMAGLPGVRTGAPYHDPAGKLGRLTFDEIEAFGGVTAFVEHLRAGDAVAEKVFEKIVENYAYRLGQVANYLNPDAVYLYTPYAELGEPFRKRVWEAAGSYTEQASIEGTELLFGGRRSNEEHLIAAAVPVLSKVFVEGVYEAQPLAAATVE